MSQPRFHPIPIESRVRACLSGSRLRSAYSIVEIMVVLFIIALLAALAAPMLGQVRSSARRTKCASQIGQHMAVCSMYAGDNQGYWPYQFRDDRVVPALKGIGDESDAFGGDWYEVIAGVWHFPCLDAYGDDQWHRSFICPADSEGEERIEALVRALGKDNPTQVGGTIYYTMSMAMYYDPVALDPDKPVRDAKYYLGTRISDAEFPSRKAAIYESVPFHERSFRGLGRLHEPPFHLNAAGVDGAVRHRDTAECVPAVLLPGTFFEGREDDYREINKLKYTPHGVRGFDW